MTANPTEPLVPEPDTFEYHLRPDHDRTNCRWCPQYLTTTSVVPLGEGANAVDVSVDATVAGGLIPDLPSLGRERDEDDERYEDDPDPERIAALIAYMQYLSTQQPTPTGAKKIKAIQDFVERHLGIAPVLGSQGVVRFEVRNPESIDPGEWVSTS